MTLLSTSSHLIKVGQDYSAGNGISIDNHVISVTGGTGTTYSAGENVSIYEQDEQLYISSKDWTNDIANASANAYNAATAQIPEPQDLSYISSKVDDKLDSTAFTNWQTGQYTTDLQTIEGQITNKLDTSSFSEVSASFLTAINIPESATWNDVSTTVQSNSAQWAEGGGSNPEVESYVINNSATIDEVNTTYQSNSANYLTAHQSLTNYYTTAEANTLSSMLSGAIDYVSANAGGAITSYTTATIEGVNAINSLNGKALISFRTQSAQEAGVADKARYDYNGNNLADDHNSLTALNGVVQTNSATWGQGGNIPVSNSGDLYKVEFDGVDLYGYKSTSSTTNYVYSAVSSHEEQSIEYSKYPTFYNVAINNLKNWSAFDIISISSNGVQIYPPDAADYGYVTALDVYYKASYLYDYNSNQLEDFSGYVGKITLDNLVISSYFDKPSYFDDIARCNEFRLWFSGNQHEGQLNNSHYICSVGNKVQTGTSTIEGILVKPTESPSSTIIVTDGNKIDCTDSAVCKTVIPSFTVTATRSSDTIRPQGEGTLHATWSDTSEGTMLTLNASIEGMLSYSSNLAQTGWLMTSPPYRTYWISLPNATAVDLWSPFSGTVSSIIVSSEAISSYEVKELAPLTALPTFEYDNTNKISAINGSAIAAGGGDVPTGTMNVSGLEYNAVNEISGYNGSAIAQYGAEKQWLVHDDTLVHAANSAQYALGVNLSALQRLMGIDETVLFENDSLDVNNGYKQTITLSEPYSAFKQLKFYYGDIYGNYSTYFDRIFNTEYATSNGISSRVFLEAPFGYPGGSSILRRTTTYRFNSLTSMTAEVNASYNLKSPITASTFNYGDGSTANADKAVKVFKVIGIGRKQ